LTVGKQASTLTVGDHSLPLFQLVANGSLVMRAPAKHPFQQGENMNSIEEVKTCAATLRDVLGV